MTTRLDTHKAVKLLVARGMDEKLAEGIIEVQQEAIISELASKDDINDLKTLIAQNTLIIEKVSDRIDQTNERINQNNLRIEEVNKSINKRVDQLTLQMNERFEQTNLRIEEINKSINDRIDQTNKRIDQTNLRIEEVNKSINDRIDQTNHRIEEVNIQINSRINQLSIDTQKDMKMLEYKLTIKIGLIIVAAMGFFSQIDKLLG